MRKLKRAINSSESVCASVCFRVSVFNYVAVYKNNLYKFDIAHCWTNVKVAA